MDFVNQTTAQLRELFASMTPGARVTAGLLVVVVVVSLGFLFQQVNAGPDEYLFGGDPISRDRLPGMEAALSTADIDHTTEGNRIKVSRADKNRAIAAIANENQLPTDLNSIMDKALDGGGMFDFRDIKLQRLRSAREQQTALILSEFPWIDRARVIYNVSEKQGLRRSRHATAAVSILPIAGESFDHKRMRTVKGFVSKACHVPLTDIEVTNLGSDVVATGGAIDPEDYELPYYRIKARIEQDIKAKISAQLATIPGVRVGVSAQIDQTSEQRVVATEPNGDPVNMSQNKLETENNQTIGFAGDRVGTEANGPQGVPRAEAVASRTDQIKESSAADDRKFAVGVTTTETISSGYALKEANASITVPMSYVETVYRRNNLGPNGEEPEEIDPELLTTTQANIKTSIEGSVTPLLPKLSLGENAYRQVNVEFFRDLPVEPLPELSLATGALGWLNQNASTLGMAGLAVFSLVMLRSMVSSTSKDGAMQGLPSLQLDGETLDGMDGNEDEEFARPKLKLRKAETLKDDLNDMVSSDPDAAAAILRSWINNAA